MEFSDFLRQFYLCLVGCFYYERNVISSVTIEFTMSLIGPCDFRIGDPFKTGQYVEIPAVAFLLEW